MKFSTQKEEIDAESSWISISSLKKASNISAIIETCQNEHTLTENLSTAIDYKSLSQMSESLNYNYLHFSQGRKQKISLSSHLLKKVQKLNEEIAILSQQLKFSNKEIEKLNKEIDKLQIENAIKLQSMQEHHEKKVQKSKSDLDFLLKDLNMKSAAILAEHFMKIHAEEIENLKQTYEKKFEDLRAKHESELIFKEMEQEKALNSLKNRFFRYIGEIEKKFEREIKGIRTVYNKEVFEIKDPQSFSIKEEVESDDEVSTGFEFDSNEFWRKNEESIFNKLGLKISITEFIERLSCESCVSTRRESR